MPVSLIIIMLSRPFLRISNLLAGIFGFNRKGVWAIQESERITPDVKELLNS